MKKRLQTALALMIAATALAGCQAGQTVAMRSTAPAATPMDGRWASTDGIFVATFGGGRFTSVDAQTDAVLAQGSYTTRNGQVVMDWLSMATSERRTATCTFVGTARVSCVQPGGATFELART